MHSPLRSDQLPATGKAVHPTWSGKTEAENLEIVQMVRTMRMTPAQLSVLLSGSTVPGSMAADNNEQEENSHEE